MPPNGRRKNAAACRYASDSQNTKIAQPLARNSYVAIIKNARLTFWSWGYNEINEISGAAKFKIEYNNTDTRIIDFIPL